MVLFSLNVNTKDKYLIMTLSYSEIKINDSQKTTEILSGLFISEEGAGFIVYLGCNSLSEKEEWISKLNIFWQVYPEVSENLSIYTKGYTFELKIKGMKRLSDRSVFDLDYMSESKRYGLDFLVHLVKIKISEAKI